MQNAADQFIVPYNDPPVADTMRIRLSATPRAALTVSFSIAASTYASKQGQLAIVYLNMKTFKFTAFCA